MSSCFMLSCFLASSPRSNGWRRNPPASAANAKHVLIVRIIRISPLLLVLQGSSSAPSSRSLHTSLPSAKGYGPLNKPAAPRPPPVYFRRTSPHRFSAFSPPSRDHEIA